MIRLCQFTGVGSSTEKGGRREFKGTGSGRAGYGKRESRVREAGEQGTGGGRAGYGRREVLTPCRLPPIYHLMRTETISNFPHFHY